MQVREADLNEILFVLSNARSGREAEYADWYAKRHLADVTAVPGVANGRFYCALEAVSGGRSWGYAGRYELERPVAEVLSAMSARAGSADMPLSDSIDSASVVMLGGKAEQPRIPAHAVDARDGDLCVVLDDATRDDPQVSEAMAAQGVLAAQSAILAEIAGRQRPWAHLVLYDVAAGRGRAVLAALTERAGAESYVGLFERIV